MKCDEDDDQITDLLYYSQNKFIPTLIKYGAKLTSETIVRDCGKLLLHGNIMKFMLLYGNGKNMGVISKEDVEFEKVQNRR